MVNGNYSSSPSRPQILGSPLPSLSLTLHSLPSPFPSFQELPDWFVSEATVRLLSPLLGLASPSPHQTPPWAGPPPPPWLPSLYAVRPQPSERAPTSGLCTEQSCPRGPHGCSSLICSTVTSAEGPPACPRHSHLQPAWLSLLLSECQHSAEVTGANLESDCRHTTPAPRLTGSEPGPARTLPVPQLLPRENSST